ncbi:restriction endonuclease subunit R [Nodularia spumigena CS-586/05]|uniref:restriction endonuclease subunit R n=1 Tax=Nodularia spumigena TaxID=70799 RepID=UPI00232B7456|nr:restriction endonuclease subunit R [Nodularia spumigena]MDB9342270.1 restriction endonuclease subunit R [Nodularia spumigena CS-588/06]MDB9348896.1 restriction endonuclease subunit R [Nodularia spumigena CS-588/01]MDB9351381.1 restriction endonuclease subunit R [Nodularia spumigena CS-588/05]MDB9362999.1 restriction endonuclease subunit R [Nodularia spumigena CS-588/02]MDB9363917.1 restriction endonuclease subunit R [Nodularia spumigena CS-588/02A10]
MVQFIQAQNVGLAYLEERFGLQQTEDVNFFPEWLENLPEITNLERQNLDRIKYHFLRLAKYPPLSEETVKLVVLSPLLNLAGFYDEPFFMRSEQSIEISAEDKGEVIRGRIDVLVIQEQFWLLVIESKRSSFSLLEAIPQALSYMLANPHPEKPVFGCVTSGEDFQFIKLIKQDKPEYALSDKFTLSRRENELYKVLSILKNLSQILS